MSRIVAPEATETMAEIRAGIDHLDRELVTMLAERMRYIEAAARVKQDRHVVRDEARKAAVIENAAAKADELGLDPTLIEELWETLVERSIAHELVQFDRLRAG